VSQSRTRAPKAGPLGTYRAKRDFQRTPEPAGKPARKSARKRAAQIADARRESRASSAQALHFVVQEHDATTRHWDFRLESPNGALVSWAVPKGPSLNPADKRMAIRTEDHPLEYAGFEGVIPEGEYGAGPVIVWDRGTYRNLTQRRGEEVPIDAALQSGHLTVWLEGEKIAGGFALTRVARGKRERWLLVKTADEKADRRRNLVKSAPRSVLSGRTIEEVA
jgi:DNA ligase D-like protein (predicted 3'-phosphoesterase)